MIGESWSSSTIAHAHADGRQHRPFQRAEREHLDPRAALVVVDDRERLLVDPEAAQQRERSEPRDHDPGRDRVRHRLVAVNPRQ